MGLAGLMFGLASLRPSMSKSAIRQCAGLLAAVTTVAGLLACQVDPFVEAQVAALGPEARGVPTGPLHRPNQPCVLCHSAEGVAAGAAETVFSIAGTVYRDAQTTRVLAPVAVFLVDSRGRRSSVQTNCVGNFYLRPVQYEPVFPVWASLKYGSAEPRDMESPIGRDGSCAACHGDPADARAVGHVYYTDDDQSDLPVTTCVKAAGR